MKQFISKYKFTIISVILVLVGILMPGDDVPSVGIPHLDKVVHCGMFGCVTVCYYWDYYKVYKKVPYLWLTIVSVVLFGALTEIMQTYVPGRSCDYRDLIADTTGIMLATIVARWGVKKYKQD
ncbi:MAG: VanZ family protein [Cellulosilyticum sp.]|nr:VanZ family protein [Cellulosilyticum sp.]